MNHLPVCRTNLKALFPNYGSECTCGAEYLLSLVKEGWEDGPEGVTEVLNNAIGWFDKSEGGNVQ